MPKKGILLIALGNPLYGNLAYNLAMSIKARAQINGDPATFIALVHDNNSISHLNEAQRFHFDQKIICPPEYYQHNGETHYLKSKLYIDKLTPFEQTIFLDADMVWSPYKNMVDLWKEFGNEMAFSIACREKKDNAGVSEWVKLEDINTIYGFTEWMDLSSEVMYIDKTKQSCVQMFEDAREFYSHDYLNVRQFAGGKPDEPFFTLAMLKNSMLPHKQPFKPSYWEYAHGKTGSFIKDVDLWNTYYLLSIGGKAPSAKIESIYNNIMKYYAHHKGVIYHKHTQYNNKGKVLAERKLI